MVARRSGIKNRLARLVRQPPTKTAFAYHALEKSVII
jgi:hypothetical protein